MERTLRAENLVKIYNKRRVVDDLSINIKQGEVVGLLGPNGAGKSTSFYMITGRILPDEGRVYIGDTELTQMPMYLRARQGLGYLPQEDSIFRRLTVRQNLELVLEEAGISKQERAEKTARLLKEYKIEHIKDTQGISLSGGERRRVEIARCLALEPSFILLDEPFSGIDPIAVADIQSMIASLRDRGYGVLLTDHNVRETLSITNRAYLIHDGQVFLEGLPDEIAQNEEAKKWYLGENFTW